MKIQRNGESIALSKAELAIAAKEYNLYELKNEVLRQIDDFDYIEGRVLQRYAKDIAEDVLVNIDLSGVIEDIAHDTVKEAISDYRFEIEDERTLSRTSSEPWALDFREEMRLIGSMY